MKYTATFSSGKTVTRTSKHEYMYAGAYVNQETGEVEGQSFGKSIPAETNKVYYTIHHPECGTKQKLAAKNAEVARIWKWEVVKVQGA